MSIEQSFCVNHPGVSTMLRCNRCGNPICTRCVVKTPVGYRCKNCVKNQQAVFYTAVWSDYVIAALVSLVISAVAQVIVAQVIAYTGILILFAGLLVGGGIAEAVRRTTGRRRGQYVWLVVAVCVGVTAAPVLVMCLLTQDWYSLLAEGLYAFVTVSSATSWLRAGK